MYARIALFAAVLAVTPLAHSGETVAALAQETGLTERNIQMLVGARSSFAEHRSNFARVDRIFMEAVGEVRYERLTGRTASSSKSCEASVTRSTQRKEQDKDKIVKL